MVRLLLSVALVAALAGCSAGVSDMSFGSGAQSRLDQNNFRVVKANVRGESQGFALFGLIPFASPSHANAMENLHSKIAAEGRAISLVNVAEDRSTIYLILFSLPKLTISADAIEFIDEASAPYVPPGGVEPGS